MTLVEFSLRRGCIAILAFGILQQISSSLIAGDYIGLSLGADGQ